MSPRKSNTNFYTFSNNNDVFIHFSSEIEQRNVKSHRRDSAISGERSTVVSPGLFGPVTGRLIIGGMNRISADNLINYIECYAICLLIPMVSPKTNCFLSLQPHPSAAHIYVYFGMIFDIPGPS
jgi:hypothetical protein